MVFEMMTAAANRTVILMEKTVAVFLAVLLYFKIILSVTWPVLTMHEIGT